MPVWEKKRQRERESETERSENMFLSFAWTQETQGCPESGYNSLLFCSEAKLGSFCPGWLQCDVNSPSIPHPGPQHCTGLTRTPANTTGQKECEEEKWICGNLLWFVYIPLWCFGHLSLNNVARKIIKKNILTKNRPVVYITYSL